MITVPTEICLIFWNLYDFIARFPDVSVLEKGIKVLLKKQKNNGDWPLVSRNINYSHNEIDIL